MAPVSTNPAWLVLHSASMLSARSSSGATNAIDQCPRPRPDDLNKGIGLFGPGSIDLQHLMIYISAGCTGLTILSCILLSWTHLRRYTVPNEQRQILRIVNLPVFYAIFNFLALTFVLDYMYIEPIARVYEAFAIAALFLLILEYVVPDGTDREIYFNNLPLLDRKKNVVPGGSLKWFQRTWSMALSYPVLKTILVICQIVTQYYGVYCESSFKPDHAHLWLTLIDYFFVGGALGAVLRFTRRVRKEAAPIHKVRAKVFSIIGIIVFQIIQDLLFHILNGKLFNPTAKATYNDINFGIASFMTCIEAVVFSFIFFYSFSPSLYTEGEKLNRLGTAKATRVGTLKAVLDALNLSDIAAGSVLAFQLLFMRVKSRYGGRSATPTQKPFRDDNQTPSESTYQSGPTVGTTGVIDQNGVYDNNAYNAYNAPLAPAPYH